MGTPFSRAAPKENLIEPRRPPHGHSSSSPRKRSEKSKKEPRSAQPPRLRLNLEPARQWTTFPCGNSGHCRPGRRRNLVAIIFLCIVHLLTKPPETVKQESSTIIGCTAHGPHGGTPRPRIPWIACAIGDETSPARHINRPSQGHVHVAGERARQMYSSLPMVPAIPAKRKNGYLPSEAENGSPSRSTRGRHRPKVERARTDAAPAHDSFLASGTGGGWPPSAPRPGMVRPWNSSSAAYSVTPERSRSGSMAP